MQNESCGGSVGNDGCMNGASLEAVKAKCCGLGKDCVSFSAPVASSGMACLKKNDDCGWKANTHYKSVVKTLLAPTHIIRGGSSLSVV